MCVNTQGIHTSTHTCIYTQTHTPSQEQASTHTDTHPMHMYSHIHTHRHAGGHAMDIHKHTYIYTQRHTYPRKNVGICTQRHTSHGYTQTFTNTHTHIHILSPVASQTKALPSDFHTPASWFYGQIIISCKAESPPLMNPPPFKSIIGAGTELWWILVFKCTNSGQTILKNV